MSDVIVFAGGKQSGKSSAGNFITGYILAQMGRRNPGMPFPTRFDITEKGELVVNAEFKNEGGEVIIDNGILDLNRRDYDFYNYAQQYIWPYVKNYAFADVLKDISMVAFGLKYEQCYGTDDDKNTFTNINWSDVTPLLSRKDKLKLGDAGKIGKRMTAREFFQIFGTEVCRQIYDDCWVEACFNRIEAENPSVAVITDCRFPNEIDYCLEKGAKVIKLTSKPFADDHASETELDKVPLDKFHLVIDNANIDITEKNQQILDYLFKVGILKDHVDDNRILS